MAETLLTLLSTPSPPPFIYLHHPHHPTHHALPSLPSTSRIAQLDAIEYHTPRLLYSGIITKLGGEEGEINTLDGFIRRLREVCRERVMLNGQGRGREKGKRKAVEMENGDDGRKRVVVVVVVTKAERLRNVLGGGWAVMTRLAELSGAPVSVVLASQAPWDDIRPHRGDAPEPIHIYLPPLTREETLRQLLPGSSHPLYPRFLDLLVASLFNLIPTSPPIEIEYLAEALWPIYTATLPPHTEMNLLNRPYPDPKDPPLPLQITMKLLTDLKHQFSLPLTSAIENLIPRQSGREEFAKAFLPNSDGLQTNTSIGTRSMPKPPSMDLAIAAKYLIVAGYCASYNPVKSDLRLFGRSTGPDGRRKKGGGTRRAGYGRTRIGKIPQRLLGPKPFPLDRLLALFASLYAEHADRPDDLAPKLDDSNSDTSDDAEPYLQSIETARRRAERRRAKEVERDERWEDEVDHLTMSVKLWSLIPELEGQGLLRRISPLDRLDNVMLRCEVDYEGCKVLAKELKITLDEYLYEATG